MLKQKFRNITIVSENHEDWYAEDVCEMFRILDSVFARAEHLMKKVPPTDYCFSITRICGANRLVVVFSPESNENPYLFCMNADLVLNDEVPLSILRKLSIPNLSAQFEEDVRNIESLGFRSLKSDSIINSIKDKLCEYDR